MNISLLISSLFLLILSSGCSTAPTGIRSVASVATGIKAAQLRELVAYINTSELTDPLGNDCLLDILASQEMPVIYYENPETKKRESLIELSKDLEKSALRTTLADHNEKFEIKGAVFVFDQTWKAVSIKISESSIGEISCGEM
jgi:hypothetical protein